MPATTLTKLSKDRKSIISESKKALPKTQRKAAGAFADLLFKHAPLEDLADQSAKALATILLSAEKAHKKSGTVLWVDELEDDQTLVTISLTNRPFIVDSILAEIADFPVKLVLHPITKGSDSGSRSLVVIVLENQNATQRKEVKRQLSITLDQVKLVTSDWQSMLARLRKSVAEFRTSPPPIPAAEIAEAVQFLEWLNDNNFTFMGIREYAWKGDKKTGKLTAKPNSALGILKDPKMTVMTRGNEAVTLTPEIRSFLNSSNPLIITKANVKSRVHRRVYLDYIGVKKYNDDGSLAGELRILGLFTSTAYTKSVMTIPVLRHKANAVLTKFRADPLGHSGKALINILETWPRDEMFQIEVERLADFAALALQLDERPRVRVLARPDRFDRFVSVIVYVPRERYDSDARIKIGTLLAQKFDGRVSAWFPQFLENGLTRVHYIIGRDEGKTPVMDRLKLEAEVTELVRTWQDRLLGMAGDETPCGDYQFPLAYQENVAPELALRDIALIEPLKSAEDIAVKFDAENSTGGSSSIRLFHLHHAVPLSRRVPMLENMGFHVIEESTFEIECSQNITTYLHDMRLDSPSDRTKSDASLNQRLNDCLLAVWSDATDDDNFNALVLSAGLDWKQAAVFRAFARYLRQIKSSFTIDSMADTLVRHSQVTRDLAKMFQVRFDPEVKARAKKQKSVKADIISALEKIQSSDDDRIIRDFLNIIGATLRTNFYQSRVTLAENGQALEGAPRPVLAFKVDPSAVSIMPQPVPYREIFVSSPRVEGLHLRFGPASRGGLRWSDRAQDYRTEVLGLVKAQQVKNAVIVPVGSKGGFLPKQLPGDGDRNAWFEEGKASYRIFISSLLSLTDNLIDGKVVPPADTVRHDDDDPYFVVAADKGTSTFSDIANGISQAYDFWLDDAFASGGSAGYDHKKMGITARGAWEAVKRHFREMDRDIQTQPFTAAGVGDMSGDVFGNGMLLSKATRLVAAFDHRDIFIDPNPDEKTSFKERDRIFKLDRSSWNDYNKKLISKGGGIFPRSAKIIALSKQAAEALGTDAGNYTPQELMKIIMRAPVDLMWFGGIGTYIRAEHESNSDVGDRGNDSIRVTAKQVRAKVIGEGANLGVTQVGRIEFNLLGGCCNSDAIDNSAGVNSSDVEVNIKIALAAAMKSGRLTRAKRNTLLESMTSKVAELVLRNNYLQTLAISLSERAGMENMAHQQHLMQQLEARDLLDRQVEDLPDDVTIAERVKSGQPLTRAEMGVLLAYAKIVALDDLVATNVPDDPYLKMELERYFPPKMQKLYSNEIDGHRLRREIIGTGLANSMINRGGPTFISQLIDRTGAPIERMARSYVAVRDSFDLQTINGKIDALDNKVSGDLQLELYEIVRERVLEQSVWFVRYGDFSKGISAVVGSYGGAVKNLMATFDKILPEFLLDRIATDKARFVAGGVPKDLALTLAQLPIAALIPDIFYAAQKTKKPLDKSASVFFAVSEALRISRIVDAARDVEADDFYDKLALDRALQSLHVARRDIVVDVLKSKGNADTWLAAHKTSVQRTREQMADIIENDVASVSRLTVAANILGDLARG